MSARSCQLCGKPLSRIWVGADGDFCSREHRNQYRLRQGMDRLQEANKVANVMRRREHLRQLSHRQLANPADASPRAFSHLRLAPDSRPVLAAGKTLGRQTDHPLARRDLIQESRAAGNASGVRPIEVMGIRAPLRRALHLPQRRNASIRAAVSPATAAEEHPAVAPAPPTRRDFTMLRPPRRRPAWKLATAGRLETRFPRAHTEGVAVWLAPSPGNALRVSYACGFRARPRRRAFAVSAQAGAAGLRWSDRRYAPASRTPAKAAALECGRAALAPRAVSGPRPPGPLGPREPLSARAIPLSPPALSGAMPGARGTPSRWTVLGDACALPRPDFRPWKPGHADPRPHVPLQPPAAAGRVETRLELAPFVPQDVPCGYQFNVGPDAARI